MFPLQLTSLGTSNFYRYISCGRHVVLVIMSSTNHDLDSSYDLNEDPAKLGDVYFWFFIILFIIASRLLSVVAVHSSEWMLRTLAAMVQPSAQHTRAN